MNALYRSLLQGRTVLKLLLLLAPLFSQPAFAVQEELLDPEDAFRLVAKAIDHQTIELDFTIAEGYYLYRKKFNFAAAPGTLGQPEFPAGLTLTDKHFGQVETYRKSVRIKVPVTSDAEKLTLVASYQGCADAGVCYAPIDQRVEITLPPTGAGSASNQESHFSDVIRNGRLWTIIAAFLGAGILLAFTPCVLPMVPILSSVIVGEGEGVTRRRALLLSTVYVLGMAVTYTVIGVAAALSGSLFSSALQNAWVLGAFSLLFVGLALSMFGFFELALPAGLQDKFFAAQGKLKGGKIASVAFMGVLAASIASPCVAAPLAGALLYISQTGDAVLGGAALFSMAIGMGLPLIAVGVSHGALPKSGQWMVNVKNFFGFLMLGLAIWIVSPVIPAQAQMLLWAAILIGAAVFMRAIDPLPHDIKGWPRLWKAVGVFAMVAGVAQLLGALSGSSDPLRPLSGLQSTAPAAPTRHVRFERVKTLAELDQHLNNPSGPIALDFYADWCVSCKEMERFTFSDAAVQSKLAGLKLLQVDVTANTPEDKALLKRFRLFGPPGIVFFDGKGAELQDPRVIGYQPPGEFLRSLNALGI